MTRFIMPVILLGIAISVFFMFARPIYSDISNLRAEVASYNDALGNSKALENERDKLTAKYNSIDPNNLTKISKLLPQNVDNIRLILEIEQLAAPYGMTLKDIKYDAAGDASPKSPGVVQGGAVARATPTDYGIFNLEFSTNGNYGDFINFTKDLQNNLRIVDISSISFNSEDNTGGNSKTNSSPAYKYNFKIKTYWLKN